MAHAIGKLSVDQEVRMRDTSQEAPRRTRAAEIGRRRTRQRTAVLNALGDCADFVSAQELHARLSTVGIAVGLSTVYRTLHELERAGRVDVVRDEAGERLYRQPPAAGHGHYLICRCCFRSQRVDTEVVERWAERIAEGSGYTSVEHTLELTGVCARCRPAVTKGEPRCRQASDRRTDHRTCPD
jgi:Fur family ferric uptake transcriptional regulator